MAAVFLTLSISLSARTDLSGSLRVVRRDRPEPAHCNRRCFAL